MKENLPVTDEEVEVHPEDVLISRTDLKGRITFASSDFAKISGYTVQEMKGKAHNIVRHPDVPPVLFKDMWDSIQNQIPWSGIIKNRAKNGACYWVEASVFPIFNGDEVVEYMSVRRKPSRNQVEEAETLYKKLWKKNQNQRLQHKKPQIAKMVLLGAVLSLLPVSLSAAAGYFLEPSATLHIILGSSILLQTAISLFTALYARSINQRFQRGILLVRKMVAGNLFSTLDTVKSSLLRTGPMLGFSQNIQGLSLNLWGILLVIRDAIRAWSKRS